MYIAILIIMNEREKELIVDLESIKDNHPSAVLYYYSRASKRKEFRFSLYCIVLYCIVLNDETKSTKYMNEETIW